MPCTALCRCAPGFPQPKMSHGSASREEFITKQGHGGRAASVRGGLLDAQPAAACGPPVPPPLGRCRWTCPGRAPVPRFRFNSTLHGRTQPHYAAPRPLLPARSGAARGTALACCSGGRGSRRPCTAVRVRDRLTSGGSARRFAQGGPCLCAASATAAAAAARPMPWQSPRPCNAPSLALPPAESCPLQQTTASPRRSSTRQRLRRGSRGA